MNYKQVRREFKKGQLNKSLRLLSLARWIFRILSGLNYLDGFIMKVIIILLGFQYDIYMKLRDASYDNSYLEDAERIKHQIEITLPLIGD